MPEKKRWKLIYVLGYVIPILLVVYVLSIGPSYAIVTNSFWTSINESKPPDKIINLGSFESFYAPIIWIEDKNQRINKLLLDYKRYCFKKMYPEYFSGGCGYSRGYSH
ncbi:hypothetical protein [Gimesia aquarii]|uniref:Uncharacterized protein n=1 Tax=Gimesia aquarii TaxID=2527964 RepID=A0A517VVZ8_9PLAN|nr:hypothetical protein [Gimesia aquarii]QDT97184.1 hypothetical protein V144x_26550 [Gimesia aquarii]